MHDAGVGRHDGEVVEAVLAPAQERVALLVALELALGVLDERVAGAEHVDLHGVVDHELGGHQRVDLRRVAAEVGHRVAHRGEVDDRGHAGEVLHHDARGREGDLVAGLGVGVPAGERLDVLLGDRPVALGAQQVLQQHLEAERQPRDVPLRLQRVEAVDRVLLAAAGERAAGVEASCGFSAWVRGPCSASSGSSANGCPSGVVIVLKCRSNVAMRCVRTRAARATSEASTRPRMGWAAAMARVSPIASAHQRTAKAPLPRSATARRGRASPPRRERRARPSRRRPAASPRGPRRAWSTSVATASWSGSPRVVEREDGGGVEDDGHVRRAPGPRRWRGTTAPPCGLARRRGFCDRPGERAADELRLGEPLVGRPAGQGRVEIGLEVEARLLHPT